MPIESSTTAASTVQMPRCILMKPSVLGVTVIFKCAARLLYLLQGRLHLCFKRSCVRFPARADDLSRVRERARGAAHALLHPFKLGSRLVVLDKVGSLPAPPPLFNIHGISIPRWTRGEGQGCRTRRAFLRRMRPPLSPLRQEGVRLAAKRKDRPSKRPRK